MNNLEQYIGDLSPSCWLNSQHINGYSGLQPVNGDFITEWKDISGNDHHAISTNYGVFIADSQGLAKLQNNVAAVQASNNLNTDADYKGTEFTISGIDKADHNFTAIIIGSIQANTPSDWNCIVQIINRFSLSSTNGAITHNTCLGINDNSNAENVINIHNYFWQNRYGLQFGARPLQLSNLLGFQHTFHPIIWTYEDSIGEHTFYDQKRKFTTRQLIKPNSNDYVIKVFNNSLDPISSGSSAFKKHGVGQEFVFWNRKLTPKEIKQAQAYLQLKYNI